MTNADSIITVSRGITLGAAEVRERVRKLLSVIPKRMERALPDLEIQQFYGLHLVGPEGNYFFLSVQGSGTAYCSPRRNLANITEYETVEVGIVPDERNRTDRFKLGTKADWSRDTETRRQIKEGDVDSFGRAEHGWLMPSDIGFTRLKDNVSDDVLGWVSVSDLVGDLTDFFMRGGVVDGTHKETQEWLLQLESALQ